MQETTIQYLMGKSLVSQRFSIEPLAALTTSSVIFPDNDCRCMFLQFFPHKKQVHPQEFGRKHFKVIRKQDIHGYPKVGGSIIIQQYTEYT